MKNPKQWVRKLQKNMENQAPTTCPRCGSRIKLVPAGVSRKTGVPKPYPAFYACSSRDCNYVWQGEKKTPDARQRVVVNDTAIMSALRKIYAKIEDLENKQLDLENKQLDLEEIFVNFSKAFTSPAEKKKRVNLNPDAQGEWDRAIPEDDGIPVIEEKPEDDVGDIPF